jgi:peptidoglycan-associated lipoprotein
MMYKKLLALLLVALLVFAVGACSKKQTTKVETEPAAEVTETAAPAVEEVTETAQPETPAVKMPVLSDVYFEFDKSRITEEAKQTLAENARQLNDAGSMAVTIEGHCDERGTNAYNLALGEKRANAAKEYLVSLGVGAGRITTISYGEEKPFDAGHDEQAWSKNRRAHFVVK